MPRLAEKRAEQNRRQIEQAALRLFTQQGFHGTNIREIAERAQVSTGAIYTYFPTKDALYESVVRNCRARAMRGYQRRILSWLGQELQSEEEPFSQDRLEGLAGEIRSFVYDHADYWKLMYIDVVEFNNRHFADSFENVPEQLSRALNAQPKRVLYHPAWRGIDPGFALATVYMQILTYFLMERLFGGNQPLGVPHDTAIRSMIDLALHGLWRKNGAAAGAPRAGAVDGSPVRRRAVRSNPQPGKPGRAAVKIPVSERKARRPGLPHGG